MITSIQEEFGSSESDQFSFSKETSNRELLRIMDLVEKNDEILQNEYFGQEGIDEMERVITEKNAIAADIKKRKTSLQDNIGTLRQEFDDRVSATAGLPFTGEEGGPLREIPFLGLVLPETLKYLTQLGAGWTDLFHPKGMEKIETRMFNWDPEAQRYGPGPEIGIEQDKLAAVLAEEEAFEEKYEGASPLYQEINDLLEVQGLRKEQIKASGIDEALDYISMENLTKLLQGQQLESNEEVLLDVSER